MLQQVSELHPDGLSGAQQKENQPVLDAKINAMRAQLAEQLASDSPQVDTLEELKWLMIQKERGLQEFAPQASVLDVVTSPYSANIVSIRLNTQPVTVVSPAKDATFENGIRPGDKIRFLSKNPVQIEFIDVYKQATRVRKIDSRDGQGDDKQFVQ